MLPLLIAALSIAAKLHQSARSGPDRGLQGSRTNGHTPMRDNARKAPVIKDQVEIEFQNMVSTNPSDFTVVSNASSPVNSLLGRTNATYSIHRATSNATGSIEQSQSLSEQSNRRTFAGVRAQSQLSNWSATGFHEITMDNFKQTIDNSDDAWIVEFYSGLCDACTQFTPTFNEFAQNLKAKVHVHVGQVNIDETRGLNLAIKLNALEFGVPTIRVFSKQDKLGKAIVSGTDADFPDGATASSLVQKALQHLRSIGVSV